MKPYVKQACDKGASSWLNALPIREQNLDLNKEEFKDALRLRYNMPLKNLPTTCPCGVPFDVTHALNCKKGGFIAKRHDNIKDFLTILLNKVCHDVQSEPQLIPVTNEHMRLKTANTNDQSRLDIKANDFWRRGLTAFFDIRVTHVNSQSNKNQETPAIFRKHETSKKREYMERVLEIEHGSFTPLVFGTNGGMGAECSKFVSKLASQLSEKQNESYSTVITWLRTRLSTEIIKSAILCVRGSRTPFRKANENIADDLHLNNVECGIY